MPRLTVCTQYPYLKGLPRVGVYFVTVCFCTVADGTFWNYVVKSCSRDQGQMEDKDRLAEKSRRIQTFLSVPFEVEKVRWRYIEVTLSVKWTWWRIKIVSRLPFLVAWRSSRNLGSVQYVPDTARKFQCLWLCDRVRCRIFFSLRSSFNRHARFCAEPAARCLIQVSNR